MSARLLSLAVLRRCDVVVLGLVVGQVEPTAPNSQKSRPLGYEPKDFASPELPTFVTSICKAARFVRMTFAFLMMSFVICSGRGDVLWIQTATTWGFG
jgi:hypothetical protein